ncbi:hypothetical protein MZM54_24510 [[Brevibacterium] frigoritolerans]|nr:hypothetical protein [Peribacillus frigoritolerans]
MNFSRFYLSNRRLLVSFIHLLVSLADLLVSFSHLLVSLTDLLHFPIEWQKKKLNDQLFYISFSTHSVFLNE